MTGDPTIPGLARAEARGLVDAALATAEARGFGPVAAAVVDLTGEVQCCERADGALPMTTRLAVAKARTALVSRMPTRATAELPEALVAPLRAAYGGDYVNVAGGILVAVGDVVLGALGVSGAASDDDEAAALAALSSLPAEVRR